MEKVALAIYREAWGTVADKKWHDDVNGRAHFIKQARAAMMAIRDTEYRTKLAGVSCCPDHEIEYGDGDDRDYRYLSCTGAGEVFAAMIDAILSEQPE